ncbi:tRNA 2 -phosphotransferase 1 [Brachionus plicatilis]|uniref:2'-phosphotransferase n=1 Tax=Brachionus plicatilis TaxID=10195 RepID=A0A3M7RQH9_BRAPC|nr:tRNA 2 -phosphotransferase 1 [Brachionus plicatilis]
MSFILRHGAETEGIKINSDGFVEVNELLLHKSMKNVSVEDILKIVENCPKKRFFLKKEFDEESLRENIFIRANQGHSINNVSIEMEEIINSNDFKTVIHGTYLKCWDKIKTEGLSKMNRQHIHFSKDLPGSNEVISGMRSNCQLAIYINLEKAIKDGIKFYKSANNVILSPGNSEGFLQPKYFLKVVNLK